MRTLLKPRGGFTLIELLIVIALIGILAGVVFVALDPLTRFRDARNARRSADISAMLSAVRVHQVDNAGLYAHTIRNSTTTVGTNYIIGTSLSGCNSICTAVTTDAECRDLTELSERGYLGRVPVDPQGSTWTSAKSGYYLRKNANNSIAVGACDTEGAPAIEITR